MLEGLKGDAAEVTRLTTQTTALDNPAARLDGPAGSKQPTVDTIRVRRTPTPDNSLDSGRLGGRPTPVLAAPPDRTAVRQRLQATYTPGRPDGQPWTARTLAEAAGCGRSSAAAFLQAQRSTEEDRS
jgi:hypothetical protein